MEPMPPGLAAFHGPTPKELELELTLRRFEGRLAELASDKRSLGDQLKIQSDKVIRLETENVRLKMTRTDKELSSQVDGLRIEVGKKDRERVELLKSLGTLRENEAIILRRAAAAEQKILVMQNTMTTMQKGRDAAYAETEKHERERLDAVRAMIDAQDRAKKAEARIAELEKKGKPPIAPQEALRPKKK